MAEIPAWYLLVVILAFLLPFAVGAHVSSKSAGYAAVKWNTPVMWQTIGVFFPVFCTAVIVAFGSPPSQPFSRQLIVDVALRAAPFVAGGFALSIAAGNAQTYLHIRSATAVTPADTAAVDPGSPVHVRGRVVPIDTALSPALSRDAVCWSWRYYIRGVNGQGENPRWLSKKGGSGGVPFELCDDHGCVEIAPAGAQMELTDRAEQIVDATATQPGRVGRNIPASRAGDEYKFVESIAEPGATLTVIGKLTADGSVEAQYIISAVRRSLQSEYKNRALSYLVAGLFGSILGLWLLSIGYGTF
ncbi:hypothetical protein HUB97_15270 [Halorubraceae archaeon YAN]|nr:hypothetical protein [Halorubraceae archaeon YAN]